jgi:peptidoglycan/LPS O-acetylase OafA/YrhL
MLQLDGIRGIAVALVVLHHWTEAGRSMDLGNIGVQLFFVLSGFLITGILLDMRASLESGQRSLRGILSTFWQGRAARIWPVCFLTLAVVFLAGDRFENRVDFVWHAVFASNFLFMERGEFGSSLAHFWTLAVEQQFYAVWPFVILLAKRTWLEPMMLALIILAPVTRAGIYVAGYHHFTQYNLLPLASFDSLGLGALVALWGQLSAAQSAVQRRRLAVAAIFAAVVFVGSQVLGPLPANIQQTFYAIVFAWLISLASSGLPGPAGRLLQSRVFAGLGTISYAVYVYHMFAPRIVGAGLRAMNAPVQLQQGVSLFALSALLTLLAASLSWFLLERPIDRARRNWQQRGRIQPSALREVTR